MSYRHAVVATAALVCLSAVTACGPEEKSADAGPAPTTAAAAPSARAGTPGAGTSASATAGAGTGAPGKGDGVPAGAWIDPRSIPLDATYHWPAPGTTAKSVAVPTFHVQTVCNTTLPGDSRYLVEGAQSGQAEIKGASAAEGDWRAKQTIVRRDPRGSSGNAQTAYALLQQLKDTLKNCGRTNSGARVEVTSPADADHVAATITVQQPAGAGVLTVHEYLAAPDGTVVELAVQSQTRDGKPKVAWPATDDAAVVKAMKSALCAAYPEC